MTGFAETLKARIEKDGPITVEAFMDAALSHYYGTRDPLGRGGDFTTAPEISQMFGELIALFLIQSWRDRGSPRPVQIAELGPGRGTLMADIRRTLAKAGRDLAEAAQIHLVETSPTLRARQEALLGPDIHWHTRLDTIPRGPILLVANEFFDALPVRQFVQAEDGWAERCVGLDEKDRFCFQLSTVVPGFIPGTQVAPCADGAMDPGAKPRDDSLIVETSPAREAVIVKIARRIEREGGLALIIDYGHEITAPGDTLQAVKNHRYADPLEEPGEADLTAHVDFAALARAAGEHARVHGPVIQSAFLNTLGLPLRAEALKRAAPSTAREIDRAVARLTGPDQMGTLFKVMALSRIAEQSLAGFS